jgi:hypothetical protein
MVAARGSRKNNRRGERRSPSAILLRSSCGDQVGKIPALLTTASMRPETIHRALHDTVRDAIRTEIGAAAVGRRLASISALPDARAYRLGLPSIAPPRRCADCYVDATRAAFAALQLQFFAPTPAAALP